MIGSCIELITTTEAELKEADKIASSIGCRTIYVVPNLVQIAGVARSLSNGKYKIYIMVDHPKGLHYGMDKFKGTSADFFLADGYDITLTPNRSRSDIEKEVTNTYSFIKEMIGSHVDVCHTLNVSIRDEEELALCGGAFYKNPPTKIKTESSPMIQPTKANLVTHCRTIEILRKHCMAPIIISGNVNHEIYNKLRTSCKIAVSPKQYEQMQEQMKKQNNPKEVSHENR